MSIQKSEAAQSSNAKMNSINKEYQTPHKIVEELLAKQFEELAIITPMSKEKSEKEENKVTNHVK